MTGPQVPPEHMRVLVNPRVVASTLLDSPFSVRESNGGA